MRSVSVALLATVAGACAPMQEHDKNPPVSGALPGVSALARGVTVETERARSKALMDSLYAAAVTGCDPNACAAVARGELLLGMSEAQLYAATKSEPAVWSVRVVQGAGGSVMVPVALSAAARDLKGEVLLAEMDGGELSAVWYRSDDGAQIVARGAALAEAGDAGVQFKLAQRLDGEMKGVEALVRYERFLQLVDGGRGAASAVRAADVATARERVAALGGRGK